MAKDLLTDMQVRASAQLLKQAQKANPEVKSIKLFDGGGLFLLIKATGTTGWRFRYNLNGKENMLSLGMYPAVSLKAARRKREEARSLIEDRKDPSTERKKTVSAAKQAREATFKEIATQWHKKQTHLDSETHKTALSRLTRHVFPFIGKTPIAEIDTEVLITMLEKIEHMPDTLKKIRGLLGQVWKYAVKRRVVTRNILTEITHEDFKKRPKGRKPSFAAIKDPREFGALLRAIHGYHGQPVTQIALRMTPLLFQRPGEVRRMEWCELDFDDTLWRIPEAKMKTRQPHLVPLSRQVIALLREIEPHTGDGKFVFPSVRGGHRPMSENTLGGALHALGYEGKHTAHGFRHSASTFLNEMGFNKDHIEAQLSHQDIDGVRATYNFADYLEARRILMQTWADRVDHLRTSNDLKMTSVRSSGSAA